MRKNAKEKVVKFHKFLINLFKRNQYEPRNIFNMDEMPMCFNMIGSTTLEPTGADTMLIQTNGADKKGFTAVLTAIADGIMVVPTINFKENHDPKVNGVCVVVQPKE